MTTKEKIHYLIGLVLDIKDNGFPVSIETNGHSVFVTINASSDECIVEQIDEEDLDSAINNILQLTEILGEIK